MLWRPYRISQFLSKRAIPNQLAAARLRPSSTLRISNPSIATILASPPALDEHIVKATGSVRTIRNQKHRSFVELGDGSTTQSLQAVLEPAQAEGCVSFLAFIGQASTDLKDGDSLGTGTSVEITGVWQSAPPGKEQSHELKAEKVKILGVADAEVGNPHHIKIQRYVIFKFLASKNELTNFIFRNILSKKSTTVPSISDPFLI